MGCNRVRSALAIAMLTWLAAPPAALAQLPAVDTPPSLEAICPAIDVSYRLCATDLMSPDCGDFVTAAHALGRLYLFNVERQPQRAYEFATTVWWGCGSAPLPKLKIALERIGSPQARALLAEAPWRQLPSPDVLPAQDAPLATEPAPPGGPEPDCSTLMEPAAIQACRRKDLATAEAAYRSELERCEALLTPFMRDQLVSAESAWQQDRDLECDLGGSRTACLADATRQRTESIARNNPPCAAGRPAGGSSVCEPLEGGPRTGMLPARWMPPRGATQEVVFTFESLGRDTVQGTMQTTLGDGGERFEGTYLRLQKSTRGDLVTAMSIGWSGPEWQLWKQDPNGGWTEEGASYGEFAHFYTGQVVALLRGDRGDAIRCQLSLDHPESGLLEGGTGRCEVTDGGRIALAF
jgi:hypothetical protein